MATKKHVVTGDRYRTIDRKMREIKRQLDQDNGSPLDPEAVIHALQKIVEGNLAKDTLPTTMTIGDRTYEILGFLKGDEKSVTGHKMVERVKDMSVHLGQDDGQHLLDNQNDIPAVFQGKVVFVFTDWHRPGSSGHMAYVGWLGDRWVRYWGWLGSDWYGDGRVLRRK